MPVRRFDGIDDQIRCAVGTADVSGAWSMAMLLRPSSLKYMVPYQAHDSGGSASGYGFEIQSSGEIGLWQGFFEVFSPADYVAVNRWNVVAITKGAGDVAPRFHSYSFATRLWTRIDGDPLPDASGTAGGHILFGQWFTNTSFNYAGDIAAAVLWNYAVPNATIDQLPATTLTGWSAVGGPVGLWLFNQAATTTALQDVIGTADQTVAPPGTTVLAEEPPIPFTSAVSVYSGSSWAVCPIHVYNGTSWSLARGLGVTS